MSLSEERMRILKLIESGQVNAEDGAQLLDALGESTTRDRPRAGRPNVLRVRVTDLGGRRQKINVTLPVGLIDVGVKLGARLFPRSGPTIEEIRRAIDSGVTGRVFEMQDLDEGERIEIFIE